MKPQAMRVILFPGKDRTDTFRHDWTVERSYAAGFDGLVGCIELNLRPTNEVVRSAQRNGCP